MNETKIGDSRTAKRRELGIDRDKLFNLEKTVCLIKASRVFTRFNQLAQARSRNQNIAFSPALLLTGETFVRFEVFLAW